VFSDACKDWLVDYIIQIRLRLYLHSYGSIISMVYRNNGRRYRPEVQIRAIWSNSHIWYHSVSNRNIFASIRSVNYHSILLEVQLMAFIFTDKLWRSKVESFWILNTSQFKLNFITDEVSLWIFFVEWILRYDQRRSF
jgi:hypothetical protein